MYTQCPECQTIFEIDEEALQTSLGIVHCGRCFQRFDALRTLSDSLPDEADEALSEHDPAEHAPILTEAVEAPERGAPRKRRKHEVITVTRPPAAVEAAREPEPPPVPSRPVLEAGSRPPDDLFANPVRARKDSRAASKAAQDWRSIDLGDVVEIAPAADETSRDMEDAAGSATADVAVAAIESAATDSGPPVTEAFADETAVATAAGDAVVSSGAHVYVPPRQRMGRASLAWFAGVVVLALVLATQLAWINRVQLLRDPASHDWVARICQSIDCRMPLIADPARLELLSRDVRPDPAAPGALTITATLRNDATFRQPWPIVVVSLTDLDDHAVAMRRFRPSEYMPDPARRSVGIASGATAAVAFEVADPGKSAVAFQFTFE